MEAIGPYNTRATSLLERFQTLPPLSKKVAGLAMLLFLGLAACYLYARPKRLQAPKLEPAQPPATAPEPAVKAYRVKCHIDCNSRKTSCIGTDQTKRFMERLKTATGDPIVSAKDEFYVKVNVMDSATTDDADQLKPDLSELPSNLFEGAREGETLKFYCDSQLVEMRLMQKSSPCKWWRAPFETAFADLKKGRNDYYKPGYDKVLYHEDADRPEGVLHIGGRILSSEARVKSLLVESASWELCTEEICEDFYIFEQQGRAELWPHLSNGIKDNEFYYKIGACGRFTSLKVLVDKGMIRVVGEREIENDPKGETVQRSSRFTTPLYEKISLNNFSKQFDRESLAFTLKDGILTVRGKLIPAAA